MIARFTRWLLLAEMVLVLLAWLFFTRVWGWRHGVSALAASVILLLIIRLIITANSFLVAWRYASPTPERFQLNVRGACRLFLSEFTATMITSSWSMPFHCFESRTTSSSGSPKRPALLVHGYLCNSGYWDALSPVLLEHGINHRALSLEPIFGSIDAYVPQLELAIETLCHENACETIDLVAHSMGGLAIRAYLRQHGTRRIRRIITLGTPHHGTHMANTGAGINCTQMARDDGSDGDGRSEWLRELAQAEGTSVHSRFVSIYSHHDNIISPQTSSHLEGAINVELGGIGHVRLARHPKVIDLVIHYLKDESNPCQPGPDARA